MGLNLDFIEVASSCLLFCLVFGMSATVDIGCMMAQMRNKRAIFAAIILQFLVLPGLGFIVVRALDMSAAMGITLLVITSSPGGSYSNWWCSMFNADLALSVTMTAISTLLSIFMLPLNLLIYARMSYEANVIAQLNWISIFVSLMIVVTAIGLGLWASEKFNSHNFNLHANRLGNFAGISLVLFSAILSNTDADSQIWERPWRFYVGVAMPCVLGLIVANIVGTSFRLPRPERVTVSVECCYQNVGIATSVALTMFKGDEMAEAIGVPFYYGLIEAAVLGLYCIIAWKAGWTKAPRNISLWKAITTSYEIITVEKVENNCKVPNDPREPDFDTFHYVRHEDDDEFLVGGERISNDGGGQLTTVKSFEHGIEVGIRRELRAFSRKKEPSFIGTDNFPPTSTTAALSTFAESLGL
mmetsp:Transcript_20610/g.23513  ORF Transcript_20610/g.23513 Transcript_20610/m.23513 type:complete len:414 (-) Transcript_20610:372-1613(-)